MPPALRETTDDRDDADDDDDDDVEAAASAAAVVGSCNGDWDAGNKPQLMTDCARSKYRYGKRLSHCELANAQ
jgi:hypothetical protein